MACGAVGRNQDVDAKVLDDLFVVLPCGQLHVVFFMKYRLDEAFAPSMVNVNALGRPYAGRGGAVKRSDQVKDAANLSEVPNPRRKRTRLLRSAPSQAASSTSWARPSFSALPSVSPSVFSIRLIIAFAVAAMV